MPLTDVELRILGSLIEKEATTPDNYPLSLNSLVLACNQTSNRDPVMTLDENGVKWAVNNLRQQSFVRAIQPADSRVMKFQHLVADKLDLDRRSLAVLGVLMLRGAQTLGELRTRTARLADFATLDDVEATVREMTARELVAELPRRPGQKEVRFAEILSGPPTVPASSMPQESATIVSEHRSSGIDARDERIASLEAVVDGLRSELAELRARFEEFQRQFG